MSNLSDSESTFAPPEVAENEPATTKKWVPIDGVFIVQGYRGPYEVGSWVSIEGGVYGTAKAAADHIAQLPADQLTIGWRVIEGALIPTGEWSDDMPADVRAWILNNLPARRGETQ